MSTERMYIRVPIGALLRRVRMLQAEYDEKEANCSLDEKIGRWTREASVWIAAGLLEKGLDPFIDDILEFTDNPRFNGRPPKPRGRRRRGQDHPQQEVDE